MNDDEEETTAVELPDHIDADAYAAYVVCVGKEWATVDGFEESYQGYYESDKRFAESMADDLGLMDESYSNQWPYTCIDWDHAARELMFDYMSENGYYFRSI